MIPDSVSSSEDVLGAAFSLAAHPLLTARLLLAAWRNKPRCVVMDTAFGRGRNFFATWQAWRDDPARSQQLHYLALAPHSCSAAELGTGVLAEALRAVWPVLVPGFHRLILDQGRVVLTLIVGDIKHTLAQVDAAVDVFYLDGLAASGTPKLLGKLARLAAPGAILAGGIASSGLQRALGQVGFMCDESRGMLLASFVPKWRQQTSRAKPPHERHAIVIGAGLAGAAACERLAARGWRLTLIERHAQAAQRASGNLAGIFMPLMSRDDNPTARLTRAAYLFALRHWQQLGGIGIAFAGEACGVLQLARDAGYAQGETAHRWQPPAEFAQWLDAAAASARLGCEVGQGGWLFPQGGWADPAGVCRVMLAACGERLSMRFNQAAMRLERAGDDWQVLDGGGNIIAQAPVVILANGADAAMFEQTRDLPLTAVRGQVTHVAADSLPMLPHVVCGEAYVTRPVRGFCCVGASYGTENDPHLRRDSQEENLSRLRALLPGAAPDPATVPLAGRVGFRCVASDRLPLVGALPASAVGLRCESLADVPRIPGLYGLLGYASRGLIWAPLAAELLAAQLEGEALPIERDLVAALDPVRFVFRTVRGHGRRG